MDGALVRVAGTGAREEVRQMTEVTTMNRRPFVVVRAHDLDSEICLPVRQLGARAGA